MKSEEMITVIQACQAGKQIQSRPKGTDRKWEDLEAHPSWDFSLAEYRVKPEPRREELIETLRELLEVEFRHSTREATDSARRYAHAKALEILTKAEGK